MFYRTIAKPTEIFLSLGRRVTILPFAYIRKSTLNNLNVFFFPFTVFFNVFLPF